MIETALRLIDPLALGLVTGGTVLAATLSLSRHDLRRTVRALRPMFRADPASDALEAEAAVRDLERIVDAKGVGCADHIQTRCTFVRGAALRLVDAASPGVFAEWADRELAERAARHESAIRFWRTAADAAPAMGMIGTVVGLVGMFAQMDRPVIAGTALAAAMLTTLYGLFIAAIVAGPAAARLERLSTAERRWQSAMLARLCALAESDPLERRGWLKRRLEAQS
jgi:chemotaxis protein MotA